MKVKEKSVSYANSLQEAFYVLKNISNVEVIAGGTRNKELPENFFSIRKIPELTSIDNKERFLDVGAATTLSALVMLGKNKIPGALYEALNSIATPFVRNIATIGGNICSSGQKLTLFAPLLAMDARLDFKKNTTEIQIIPISKYKEVPKQYILTKIRIPLEDWDISIFRRIGPSRKITKSMASYTFLARMENSVIANVRVAFSGVISFRCKEIEDRLMGTSLPLSSKIMDDVYAEAVNKYDSEAKKIEEQLPPIVRQQFLNLIQYSLEQLT